MHQTATPGDELGDTRAQRPRLDPAHVATIARALSRRQVLGGALVGLFTVGTAQLTHVAAQEKPTTTTSTTPAPTKKKKHKKHRKP